MDSNLKTLYSHNHYLLRTYISIALEVEIQQHVITFSKLVWLYEIPCFKDGQRKNIINNHLYSFYSIIYTFIVCNFMNPVTCVFNKVHATLVVRPKSGFKCPKQIYFISTIFLTSQDLFAFLMCNKFLKINGNGSKRGQ